MEKMYFPFALGNGLDMVMVDYSGSTHCDSGHFHLEQHEGAICCWEKISHRNRKRSMVPIVQFPYRVMSYDGELYEIGEFLQKFDPWKSVLFTEVETTILKLRIITFLTDASLYIERYQVLWADKERNPQIVFLIRKPIDNMPVHTINFPQTYQLSFYLGEGGSVYGEYSFDEVRGNICMAVKVQGHKVEREIINNQQAQIKVKDIKKGDIIERYISVYDNSHESKYHRKSWKVIARAISEGYDSIYKKHTKEWEIFQSQTVVKIPEGELEDIYRKSLWLIRASQNKEEGFITEGLYSGFKGGGYSCHWDLIFALRALVTANQRELALKLLDWYERSSIYARIYAKQLNQPGVYFPWMTNWKGESIYFEDANEMRNIEKFNNCCLTLQIFDIYRFWGDKKELKKRIGLIKDILDFLIAEIVVKEKDYFIIKPMQGGDENIDRVNDTVHLLTLIEGLKGYLEGCRILGIPLDEKYISVLKGLQKGMKGNYKDGILLQFRGDRKRPVSSAEFTYHILTQPKGIPKKNLYEALKDNMGKWGLTNSGTYRNLIWPWTENRAAIAFSAVDPKITYQRLKHVINFTSTHGIFPEKVRPDGFWILFGYLSAHSSFVYAVNSLLASDNEKTLYIGAGFPSCWRVVVFKNIYTPSGYGVSLQLEGGKVKELYVENCRDESRYVKIHLLNENFGKEFRIIEKVLKPGKNSIL